MWCEIKRKVEQILVTMRTGADELLYLVEQLMPQKINDKNKLYSLHAPEVEYISKGKARQRYEFGVNVSLAITKQKGLIVGARSFPGNTYDGHTLAEQFEQTKEVLNKWLRERITALCGTRKVRQSI